MVRPLRCLAPASALLCVLLSSPSGARAQDEGAEPSVGPIEDAAPPSPRAVLEKALENRYELDARASIEIVVTSASGATDLKRAEMASKRVDGNLFSIGRFTYPDDLRGMAMLRKGVAGRQDDFFAYIPELRKVRRLALPERADMFIGTDATFEDVERRKIENYAVEFLPSENLGDDEAWVVTTRPTYESSYDRVDFLVAKTDYAILEQRHYRGDLDQPFKIIRTPRETTRQIGGHAVPMVVFVEDLDHGTRTELRIVKIEVNPKLPTRLFTIKALSRETRLPRLKDGD